MTREAPDTEYTDKGLSTKEQRMQEQLVNSIASLDGHATAAGRPGGWGLEGPEYLSWFAIYASQTFAGRTQMLDHAPTVLTEVSS